MYTDAVLQERQRESRDRGLTAPWCLDANAAARLPPPLQMLM